MGMQQLRPINEGSDAQNSLDFASAWTSGKVLKGRGHPVGFYSTSVQRKKRAKAEDTAQAPHEGACSPPIGSEPN
jgi:hypothetical protein